MVDDSIVALASAPEGVAAREVAAHLGITRQAAHRRLRALVEGGRLRREGAGRGTRYHAISRRYRCSYSTAGLVEERVWHELRARVPEVRSLGEEARAVFGYAVTELVNNAIDHSGSAEVHVEVGAEPGLLVIEVIDDGVGIFEHVRAELRLESDLAALQELSKGKTTTQPSRHTGEGLFFTSKAADRFEIESGRLRWITDNVRGDTAVGELDPPRHGTRVVFAADPSRPRELRAIFDAYTDDLEFTRTRTVVKLFSIGTEFISRSEAKRLAHGLENFREVLVDFQGVRMIGQGFADELFRVWQRDHPGVRLVPVNMIESVAFFVERARRG